MLSLTLKIFMNSKLKHLVSRVYLVWDSRKTAAAISEKGAYRAENGGTFFMGTQNRTALPDPPHPPSPEDAQSSLL